jgi:hypothetical protein
MEKTVSGERPSNLSASSTVSTEFSEYTPTWSPVSYLKQVFKIQTHKSGDTLASTLCIKLSRLTMPYMEVGIQNINIINTSNMYS